MNSRSNPRSEDYVLFLQILLVLGVGYLLWRFRHVTTEDVDQLIANIRKFNTWANRLPF